MTMNVKIAKMEMTTVQIINLAITVFLSQVIFIGCRTWNVKAISKHNIPHVLLSGGLVHLSWLVSISIGATSMHQLMINFRWEFIPVIMCSLVGGLIGSYIPLHKDRKK